MENKTVKIIVAVVLSLSIIANVVLGLLLSNCNNNYYDTNSRHDLELDSLKTEYIKLEVGFDNVVEERDQVIEHADSLSNTLVHPDSIIILNNDRHEVILQNISGLNADSSVGFFTDRIEREIN